MTVYYLFHVWRTAVAQFDGVSVIINIFRNLWPVAKHLSIRLMKALPTLDLTFLLNGGLNHMTSLRLFFCFGCLCGIGLNLSLKV